MTTATLTEPLTIRQTYIRWAEELCPAGAYALAVEHREGPTTPGADRGQAIHDIFSRYVTHLWRAGRQTDWEAAAEIARVVVAAYSLTFDQRQDVLAQAQTIAEGFLFEREHFYGSEEALETTIVLNDGRHVRVTGRIDLLLVDSDQGVARIVDAKSSPQIYPDARVRGDFQLRLYALLVADNLPHVDTVEGELYLTRYGIRLPQQGRAVWSREDLEEFRRHLRDRLTQFYEGRLAREFVPGAHCHYCPRRRPGDCVRWRSYQNTEAPPIRTFYQARRAAGRVIALEQEREALLGHLKAYVEENGPVTVGPTSRAETWGFHQSAAEEFRASDVRAVLELPETKSLVGEVPFDKVFRVDRSGATFKRLRKHPDLRDHFDEIAEERHRTTFSHKAVDHAV